MNNFYPRGGIREYQLSGGGWVKFDWIKDVQACRPHYEGTIVVLTNETHYLLSGRNYGV